jgi:dUTP pyrophosphatase
MEQIEILVQRLSGTDDLPLPAYMTAHAAGMDLYAAVEGQATLLPGRRKLVPTGIAVALPEGFEAEIRPRSGLAIKHGITLLNAPGTIDADYRGEIKIIMANLGEEPFVLNRGDRIAQMVVHRVLRGKWTETAELPPSRRNDGGFGHTGT